MRTRLLPAVCVGLAVTFTVSGCGGHAASPAAHRVVHPESVRLSPAALPATTRIGMIVSLQAAPGQGSEWAAAATGAQLAAYRFDAKGHRVDLVVRDDHGTAAGARKAVAALVGQDVSGIVVATSGSHLEGALSGAGHTPLVLPYQTSRDGLPANAWLTGPTDQALGTAVSDLVDQQGWKSPYVVHSETSTIAGLGGDQVFVRPGAEPGPIVAKIKRAKADGADVVVADLPATTAASLVAALQKARVDLPVVLGREGVSPSFGSALESDGGSLSGQLFSAGTDAADVSSLTGGNAAGGTVAYFAAMRQAVDSPLTGLFGQGTYGARAGSSDTASHDAIVVLLKAVAAGKSTSPDKVQAALGQVRAEARDGLAGPTLEPGDGSALAATSVVPLVATSQDPGVRPAGARAPQKLFWFAVPSATAS